MNEHFTEEIIVEVPRQLKDKRFDRVLFLLLQKKFPENKSLSRGFAAQLIQNGQAILNGKVVLPRVKVLFQDRIVVANGAFVATETTYPPSEVPDIEVLFENVDLIVINKPVGVAVHGGAAGNSGTVVAWILATYPALATVGEDATRPGIVHRLDRETSGVLLIAKNNEMFQILKDAFQERLVEKRYVALVYGHMPNAFGTIDTPLMRLSGELKRKAVDMTKEMAKLPGTLRSALTQYQVVAHAGECDVLVLSPKTGRTHQIRVHLASIGYPVVGDKLYAFKPARRGEKLFPARHMLHAASLSLSLGDQKYIFTTPLPEDFRGVLYALDPVTYEATLTAIEMALPKPV